MKKKICMVLMGAFFLSNPGSAVKEINYEKLDDVGADDKSSRITITPHNDSTVEEKLALKAQEKCAKRMIYIFGTAAGLYVGGGIGFALYTGLKGTEDQNPENLGVTTPSLNDTCDFEVSSLIEEGERNGLLQYIVAQESDLGGCISRVVLNYTCAFFQSFPHCRAMRGICGYPGLQDMMQSCMPSTLLRYAHDYINDGGLGIIDNGGIG